MYDINSAVIAIGLFIAIILANEIGIYFGEKFERKTDEDAKSQSSSIQGGIIGMLALIIGFTFSMSVARYDNRAAAEVAEANAIGTTMLRTELLPGPDDRAADSLMSLYIDHRVESVKTDVTDEKIRKQQLDRTSDLQSQIWRVGIRAAEKAPNPVTTGYFVTSVNDMIDAQGKRNDILQRSVPATIYYLMFVIFIFASVLTGYVSGLGKRNPRVPAIIMGFLISLMIFVIIDLDRPRRGMIAVKQDSMEALK
ncbi:bestrophin-like domain [Nonlabens antarcticus]|uniref:bestrophin-like domain n=1 Tax=Nonlabens antarcticus TaxID=392714 RepID=UPI001891C2FE|nr:hypothetical protein [Nonlabens antarcticus]